MEPDILTCSRCRRFCASWSYQERVVKGDVKYHGGRHAHTIYDEYHQGYGLESDFKSYSKRGEPTLVGPGKENGCSVEQRVAFLGCLYKISAANSEYRLFSDPNFLKLCFKDLIHDSDKTIRFAVLYSCDNFEPEAYALPRKHGVAEIENMAKGKLQPFAEYWEKQKRSYDLVAPSAWTGAKEDEAEHFVLTQDQWAAIRGDRTDQRCKTCVKYLSVITYHDKDSVNVRWILRSLFIC